MAKDDAPLTTDIPRLRAGHVGGQFCSVWISTSVTGPAAVQMTIEHIDLVHRMVARDPNDLEMATTAADVERIDRAGRIASPIGIEGGHQIDESLASLRHTYVSGALHDIDAHLLHGLGRLATDNPAHHGLHTVRPRGGDEMDRLGLLATSAMSRWKR